MYIIGCPVMTDEYRYNDGRYEAAWERERDMLDNSDIAEAVAESTICPSERDGAYVALADASYALERIVEIHGKSMLPSHLTVMKELHAMARVASTELEKVIDDLVAKRLGVDA